MDDTITAVASAHGKGAIAIIRVSGEQAFSITDSIVKPKNNVKFSNTPPRTMVYCELCGEGGARADIGMAVRYAAPHSYTGEDSAELFCHGGKAVTAAVLDAVIAAGARLAQPGEFTRRAFFNSRLDLTAAEAVGEIIDADTPAIAAAAARRLDGSFGERLRAVRDAIITIAAHYAACIDYADEGIEPPDDDDTAQKAMEIYGKLDALAEGCRRGRIMRDGIPTVIIGRPNAGKSSVLNLLLGCDRAIVTDVPGTTRDIIEELCDLGGVKLRVSDTAGLRDGGDEAERIGVARGKLAAESATLVVAVFDGASMPNSEDEATEALAAAAARNGAHVIKLVNKSDLGAALGDYSSYCAGAPQISFSARDGAGMRDFSRAVRDAVSLGEENTYGEGNELITVRRQAEAIISARDAMARVIQARRDGFCADILWSELCGAADALGELTGDTTSEDVIDAVFRDFCVGK